MYSSYTIVELLVYVLRNWYVEESRTVFNSTSTDFRLHIVSSTTNIFTSFTFFWETIFDVLQIRSFRYWRTKEKPYVPNDPSYFHKWGLCSWAFKESGLIWKGQQITKHPIWRISIDWVISIVKARIYF